MSKKDELWDRIEKACDRIRETKGAFFALALFYKWLRWADKAFPELPIRIYPEQVEEEMSRQGQGASTHKGEWPLTGAGRGA